jgi:hypothetical protein
VTVSVFAPLAHLSRVLVEPIWVPSGPIVCKPLASFYKIIIVHDQTASPHWARRAHGPKRRFLSAIKAPLQTTLSLQLTSRIFGNMMADCIEVAWSNNGSVISQTAHAAIFFLICASGINEVGWKAASRRGRRLI